MSASLSKERLFLKTLGPNGKVITMVSWKAGSREVQPGRLGALLLFRLLRRKGDPKDAFLKTMKIENGSNDQLFIKVRHLDPSKMVQRSGFPPKMKSGRNINGFWWAKTIGNYWKTDNFLDFWSCTKIFKKRCQMGDSKVMFWGSKMTTWASEVRVIIWFLTF